MSEAPPIRCVPPLPTVACLRLTCTSRTCLCVALVVFACLLLHARVLDLSVWIFVCAVYLDCHSGAAVTDVNEQQLDLRSKNSWMLKLDEVRLGCQMSSAPHHPCAFIAASFSPITVLEPTTWQQGWPDNEHAR